MSSNFAELAQVRVGEVERPKPVPEGHYSAVITGPMKEHKAKSGNLAMRFPFKLLGPGDDVDAGELENAGGIPDKEFTLDFWMSPDARFRFTDFACKAQGLSDDLSLIELAEALISDNKPFLIQNNPQQSEDNPEIWYNRFDNPTAAE
jgi:hypothetical protein